MSLKFLNRVGRDNGETDHLSRCSNRTTTPRSTFSCQFHVIKLCASRQTKNLLLVPIPKKIVRRRRLPQEGITRATNGFKERQQYQSLQNLPARYPSMSFGHISHLERNYSEKYPILLQVLWPSSKFQQVLNKMYNFREYKYSNRHKIYFGVSLVVTYFGQ